MIARERVQAFCGLIIFIIYIYSVFIISIIIIFYIFCSLLCNIISVFFMCGMPLFLLSTIFFFFFFYKQHNIISKIKQNKTADIYSTSHGSIKREGEREGHKNTKDSFK